MASARDFTATTLIFTSRKPGMSFEEYQAYYENNHVPLITRLVLNGKHRPIGFTRQYVKRDRTGDEPAVSFPFGGVENWNYDCVTRVVFRDRAHRDSSLGAYREHLAEIAADEAKFLDTSKIKIVFVAESATSRL